jgi:histidinol-phosphatase
MLVAEGAVDIAAEPSLALWDMAALDVIVREAGGTFSNLAGEIGPFGGNGISTNTLLHSTVMAALN